jgi:2'-5' RNA ligase
MKRLFIAIDFPCEIKDSLANMCFGIPGAKWVSKDQFHLTLRFIGDTHEKLFLEILEILKDVNVSKFEITLKGVGYFPPRKKPNVLWVGIEESNELMYLKEEIESLLDELGISREPRKFYPHLTLARLKPETPLSKITEFLSSNNLFKTNAIPVTEFHLYSSQLFPSGAIHTKEASYSLL